MVEPRGAKRAESRHKPRMRATLRVSGGAVPTKNLTWIEDDVRRWYREQSFPPPPLIDDRSRGKCIGQVTKRGEYVRSAVLKPL